MESKIQVLGLQLFLHCMKFHHYTRTCNIISANEHRGSKYRLAKKLIFALKKENTESYDFTCFYLLQRCTSALYASLNRTLACYHICLAQGSRLYSYQFKLLTSSVAEPIPISEISAFFGLKSLSNFISCCRTIRSLDFWEPA